MYSYKDLIRAVNLFIKLGKRTGPTVRRMMGYSTKNSLKGWYREHQQRRDLRAGYAHARRKYSVQQLQTVGQHYLDHDCCIASILSSSFTSDVSGIWGDYQDSADQKTDWRVKTGARSVTRVWPKQRVVS